MPVYEERLISPLAVRFSQEQIPRTFGNGMKLDDVVELVEVVENETSNGSRGLSQPRDCPYDVLLKPPFPNIEILRWAPGSSKGIPLEPVQHWYTKDNRRLYVLQRAATKFWPKKVGVEVDVLFAAPRELQKNYESSTAGLLVALNDEENFGPNTFVWHWGHAVTNMSGKIDMSLERAAFQQLKNDDLSSTLAGLVSLRGEINPHQSHLPGFSSDSASTSSEECEELPQVEVEVPLLRVDPKMEKMAPKTKKDKEEEQQSKGRQKGKQPKLEKKQEKHEKPDKDLQEVPEKGKKVKERSRGNRKKKTPKAKEESEESEESESEDSESDWWPDFEEHWEWVASLLGGVWKGPKGETYEMYFEDPKEDKVKGFCTRTERKGSKTFSIRYDYHSMLLWWGTGRKFCLDPEELRTNRSCAKWYTADGAWTPEFEWQLTEESSTKTGKSRRRGPRNRAG